MNSKDNIIEWTKFVDEDPKTHPAPFEKVLALEVWSKGTDHQWGSIMNPDDRREADFYEPVYGFYCRKRDLCNCPDDADDADDTVFALDEGNQEYDGEGEDWRDPPKWWSPIKMPQELDLDIEDDE